MSGVIGWYEVCYMLSGTGVYNSGTVYTTRVYANNMNQARELVIAQNGGSDRCRVTAAKGPLSS